GGGGRPPFQGGGGGGGARVALLFRGGLPGVGKGLGHKLLEPAVQPFFFPNVPGAVHDPLEEGYGDAAGIGQDVGHHGDAPLLEDVVAFGGDGAVGCLHHHLALQPFGHGAIHLVFQGGGNHDVHGQLEKVLGGDGFAARKAGHGAGGRHLLRHGLGVQALFVVDAAGDVHHGYDAGAGLLQELAGEAAHVAVALQGYGGALDVDVQPLGDGLGDEGHAPAGGGLAGGDAADGHGLAGEDGRFEGAVQLGVFVGHPAHDDFIGAQVGGGHVPVGA